MSYVDLCPTRASVKVYTNRRVILVFQVYSVRLHSRLEYVRYLFDRVQVCELIIPSFHDGARDLGTAPALAARRPPRYARDVSRQI